MLRHQIIALTVAAAAPVALAQQAVPQLKPVGASASAPQPATLAYPLKSAPAPAPSSAPAQPVAAKPVSVSAPVAEAKPEQKPAPAPARVKPKPRAKQVQTAPAPVAASSPIAEVAPFNFKFDGDVMDALAELRSKVPQLLVLAPTGKIVPAHVSFDLRGATVVDVLRAVGEQAGDVANVVFNGAAGTVRLVFKASRVKEPEVVTDPIAEAKRWQSGGAARPVMGPDGVLLYPFGMGQPELTCAPLRACVIHLQPGEVINNVNLGDQVRWIASPARSGAGATAVQQIILKPWPTAEATNMVVSTDRRTYTFALKRTEADYLSQVGFYYPQDMVQAWNGEAVLAQRKADEDAKRKVSDLPIASMEQLNLDGYRVKGDRDLPWYPVRVFDDGTHVWIQMPPAIRSADAPALVLLDQNGGSELVNYRVKRAEQGGEAVTYYIVDKLFERAGLILGVGRDQRKVEILRNEKRRVSSWGGNRYED